MTRGNKRCEIQVLVEKCISEGLHFRLACTIRAFPPASPPVVRFVGEEGLTRGARQPSDWSVRDDSGFQKAIDLFFRSGLDLSVRIVWQSLVVPALLESLVVIVVI